MDGTCETERGETSMVATIARFCQNLSSLSRLEESPASQLITVVDRHFEIKSVAWT